MRPVGRHNDCKASWLILGPHILINLILVTEGCLVGIELLITISGVGIYSLRLSNRLNISDAALSSMPNVVGQA